MARICMLLTRTPWGDQRQFFKQAPALVNAGHELIFVADDPGRKVTDRFTFLSLSLRERRISGITGALNLLPKLLSLDPDVIQLCSVEQLPLGLILKMFTGIQVVYDCREDMYHGMRHSKNWLPLWFRVIMANAVRGLEYLASRTFDGLVASDPAIFNMHYGMPAHRKVVFFNTPLLNQFCRTYAPLALRPYDVVLMGSMSQRSGMGVLIKTLQIMIDRGRQMRVLLIGSPDVKDKIILQQLCAENKGRIEVEITGWRPYPEIPELLAQAKIGLVLLLDMPKFRHNIACKAFEYMACEMPVVASDLPPQRFFLPEGELAIFFKPGCSVGLADAIEKLLDNLPRAQAMGQAGRAAFENYWHAERDQDELVRFYDRILRSRRRSK